MPKKKAGAFNATQIKNGTIKAILDDYVAKHPKKDK